MCIVFDLQEHNLRLKPTKCQFFWNEINYLAHHISREDVWLGKENLRAMAGFAVPQTHVKILAFLGLVEHYWQFIKSFVCIAQPLHKHLSWEGASKNSRQVLLMMESKDAFETLKKACLKDLCWLLQTLTSPICWKLMKAS